MLSVAQKKGRVLAYIILLISLGCLIYFLYSWSGEYNKQGKRELVNIIVAAASILVSAVFIFSKAYLYKDRTLWFNTIFLSVVLMTLIPVIMFTDYYLTEKYRTLLSGYILQNNQIIHDEQDLQNYIKEREKKLGALDRQTLYIPTAVNIMWLEVNQEGSFRISGYVWQTFDESTKHLMSNELFFDDAFEQEITKVFQFKDGNREVIGWHCNAHFAADYKFLRFPLDKHTISWGISHKSHKENVLFIPDFSTYNKELTGDKIGVSPDCELINWFIIKSDFSYYNYPLNADYGYIEHTDITQRTPQPWFLLNIIIKRDFGFLLLYSFAPLGVIFFILYCVVIFIGLESLKLSQIVTYISAILFATLVSHDLYSKSLPNPAIEQNTYIDILYFLAYIYTLFIGFNGMVYYSNLSGRWMALKYRNNFIVRLFYWPVLLFLILLATLYAYY